MEKLQNLSAINTNTIEGRLLVAAMAKISGIDSFKEPDIILQECYELAEQIYKDAVPIPERGIEEKKSFEKELSTLINRHSMENNSNTPDYILAKFLNTCLFGYETAVKNRDKWFEVNMWANDKIDTP